MRLSVNSFFIMKLNSLISCLVVAVILSTSAGCRRKPQRLTNLPGSTPPVPEDVGTAKPRDTAPPVNTDDGKVTKSGMDNVNIPTSPTNLSEWLPSADQPWKGKPESTVYFDFDKATIKASEVGKIERVAAAMKNFPGKAVRVEGHADERGTEEYNRSLGERRALAVRESLVKLGMDYKLIDTVSYGEDKPVDPGHNDTAWKKNRRGEFILLDPPGASATK
jgi:peptidoglycan-associated lipoprotein